MDEFKDTYLVCVCGLDFNWTAGEQAFMNDLLNKGKIQRVIPPKRCPDCRMIKKRERALREEGNN